MNTVRVNAISVLGTCLVMNMLARGSSETFAVFLLPFEQAFHASRAELTGVYSIYMLVNGLSSPLTGALFDRYGPRATYVLGLLSLAAGNGIAACAHELWHLYISLGVLIGIGVAASIFPGRGLGAIYGAITMGMGVGVAIGSWACFISFRRCEMASASDLTLHKLRYAVGMKFCCFGFG